MITIISNFFYTVLATVFYIPFTFSFMNFIILSELITAVNIIPIINNANGCDMIFSIRDFLNGVLFSVHL